MSAVQLAPEHRVTTVLLRLAGHRTPDRIAAHLYELGVRGDHSCSSCPIAVHIQQETQLEVLVTQTTWQFLGERAVPWTLPDPVSAFIQAHDRNGFPHLRTAEVTV